MDDAFPGRAAFDVAVSRALLQEVADGTRGECLRLYRPDDVVAFSLTDATRPGFDAATAAARGAGFDAALRLAGGSAAVFHRETLAFAWCLPCPDPRVGIEARFALTAEWIAAALRRLGVDARVGEVPGEYCPGAHSVNAGGRRKLMGVGQRIVRGAAYVGGVLVVGRSQRVRDALDPVYPALGLGYDADTAGSVEDEIGPISLDSVRRALLEELAVERELAVASPSADTLGLAARLEPNHRPTRSGASGGPAR